MVALQQGTSVKNWSLVQGVLRRKSKVLVGHDPVLKADILTLCHASTVGGHLGFLPTLHRLKGMFYWKKCSQDVRLFVTNENICQRAKYERVATPGLLQPLPTPSLYLVMCLWILLVDCLNLMVKTLFL